MNSSKQTDEAGNGGRSSGAVAVAPFSGLAADIDSEGVPPPAREISIIGNDITITGNIEAEVDLHIEGTVHGDVRCVTLILGERSAVMGSIYAERVRVAGTVEGGIETTDLAIEAVARVKGDVTYSRLRIANGGIVQGTLTHKPLPETKLTLVEGDADQAKVHYID